MERRRKRGGYKTPHYTIPSNLCILLASLRRKPFLKMSQKTSMASTITKAATAALLLPLSEQVTVKEGEMGSGSTRVPRGMQGVAFIALTTPSPEDFTDLQDARRWLGRLFLRPLE